ncbi:hypothetical protein PCANC_14350 [Puccinia coronata f. sp. avenae]|uniref:Uncharacterized protein n=1 Tax=Puccinia coronata f. sp. avenae TaxID=200324 RepID=A0A2N5V9G9_9BASI|nr:hypothetical protein PCANC_14350 [Puccinia coronata f. sp. avenae]
MWAGRLSSPRLRVLVWCGCSFARAYVGFLHQLRIEPPPHRHRTTDAPPSNHKSGPSYKPSPVERALGPPLYKGSYRYHPTGPHQIKHDTSSTAQINTPQLLRTGFQTLNKINNAGSSRALFVSQANRSLRATRTINEIDAFVRRLASFDRSFALKLV